MWEARLITTTQPDSPRKLNAFKLVTRPVFNAVQRGLTSLNRFPPVLSSLGEHDASLALQVSGVRVHFALSPKLGTTRGLEFISSEDNRFYQQGHRQATLTSLENQAAPIVIRITSELLFRFHDGTLHCRIFG